MQEWIVFLCKAKLEILRMSVGKLFQINGPTHLIENIRVFVRAVLQHKCLLDLIWYRVFVNYRRRSTLHRVNFAPLYKFQDDPQVSASAMVLKCYMHHRLSIGLFLLYRNIWIGHALRCLYYSKHRLRFGSACTSTAGASCRAYV